MPSRRVHARVMSAIAGGTAYFIAFNAGPDVTAAPSISSDDAAVDAHQEAHVAWAPPHEADGLLGARCARDLDCSAGLRCARKGADLTVDAARGEDDYPAAGICTLPCTTNDDCLTLAEGAVCHAATPHASSPRYCLEPCRAGATTRWPALDPAKCHGRADLACSDATNACEPSCGDDANCASGDACEPTRGACRSGLAHGAVDVGGGAPCGSGGAWMMPSMGEAPTLYCTEACTIGALAACGWDGRSSPAPAGCLLARRTGLGAGDRGDCARLCDRDADCASPSRCLPLSGEEAATYGRAGWCWAKGNDAASDPHAVTIGRAT